MNDLYLIEVEYDDDPGTEEACNYEINEQLERLSDRLECTRICVKGAFRNVETLESNILKNWNLDRNAIFFFGQSPIDRESQDILYVLEAVRVGSMRYLYYCVNSGAEHKRQLDGFPLDSKANKLWYFLSSLQCAADKPNLQQFGGYLRRLRDLSMDIDAPLFSAALRKSIAVLLNAVDIEIALFQGGGVMSHRTSSRNGHFDLLCDNPIVDIKKSFDSLKAGLGDINWVRLNERIEYLEAGRLLSDRLRNDVERGRFPWAFVWYASYFVSSSLFYKRHEAYSAAITLLMRALECFLEAVLIFRGRAEYDVRQRLTINGERVSGIGSVWTEASGILRDSLNDRQVQAVWEAIEFRNKLVFGHGPMHGNEESFNEIYTAVTDLIGSTRDISVDPSNLWPMFNKMGRTNVVRDAEKLLCSLSLIHLGFRLDIQH